MDAARLLHWQYLIYLLPGGASALLLLLSSLRMGHRGAHGGAAGHGGHGGHAHTGASASHGGAAHASAHGAHAPTAPVAAHSGTPAHHASPVGTHAGPKVQARMGKVEVSRHGANKENVTISTNLILHIMGADRAPLAMLLEAFCLVWGLCGYWANEFTVHSANPQPSQMLPSLGIALGGGIVGTRIAATLLARVMPQDESQDVSREGLYGMTGRVVFPVSATGGRIHIYDAHGTLHDETCRLAPGHEAIEKIEKGRTVLIMDRDAQGHLLVEEVPG